MSRSVRITLEFFEEILDREMNFKVYFKVELHINIGILKRKMCFINLLIYN